MSTQTKDCCNNNLMRENSKSLKVSIVFVEIDARKSKTVPTGLFLSELRAHRAKIQILIKKKCQTLPYEN